MVGLDLSMLIRERGKYVQSKVFKRIHGKRNLDLG